jgi:hypothetical protein
MFRVIKRLLKKKLGIKIKINRNNKMKMEIKMKMRRVIMMGKQIFWDNWIKMVLKIKNINKNRKIEVK